MAHAETSGSRIASNAGTLNQTVGHGDSVEEERGGFLW